MDVIATPRTEKVAEKNLSRKKKLRERRRKKKLFNQTNQNAEIASNEKCHGLSERGSYGGLAVERVLSDTVKETSHDGTRKRKRNSESSGSKNELEPMDQEPNRKRKRNRKRSKSKTSARNKDGQVISEQENKCLETFINKKSCTSAAEPGIKEPLLQELAVVSEVSTKTVKEKVTPERKPKKKKKSKARNKDAQQVDSKTCIEAAELPEVEKVSTEIGKEIKTSEEKRKRKMKLKALDKDGDTILDKENKCLEIFVDRSCSSAPYSGIKGVDLTVKSLLQETLEAEEVVTDIVQKQKTPEEKQRRKIKSYHRNERLKISDNRSSCIVASDIVPKQKTPQEKQRRKIKSYYRDNNVKVIPGKEVESREISDDRKSRLAASETAIKVVDPNVESLLQDYAVVDEASTEIVKVEKNPEGKQRQKTKLKTSKKNKVEVPIVDQQDIGKCCNGIEMGSLQRVESLLHEEDNCPKISAENKSCVAASVLAIKDVDLNVESLLPDSAVAEEASTPIVDEKKGAQGKKTKLKTMNKYRVDVPITDQKDELLLTSINGEGCEETEMGTLHRVDPLLHEEDNCPKISADKKSCVAASVLAIKDVDSNVESLLPDSAVADEASTAIVDGKKGAQGKKTKLKTRNKDKVDLPITDQQDELMVTSINGKCCKETEMDTLQDVDSRSKFPSDNVSSLAINGTVGLPNDFDQLPQRAVTTRSRKILLILDINGLLADIVMPPPKDRKSDINMWGRAIFKRPYCDDFLNFCFDTFDVAIWSSRTKRVIDKVVDYLLGERKQKLLFCWDLSQTTMSKFKTLEDRHKPLVCKGLSNLWEKRYPDLPWEKGYYNESNTLLIDDSPYKALLNPIHTAIFPHSFTYKDQDDTSLGPEGELRVYLQDLAKTDDVRRYVEEHPFGQSAITKKSPSWGFYSKVVNSFLH